MAERQFSIVSHNDSLIDENNDPVHDPEPLRDYIDKWDGPEFIKKMCLDEDKSVLVVGVGTGRLAVRVAPLCGKFCGIDISPKTIKRARENLAEERNISLTCGDLCVVNKKLLAYRRQIEYIRDRKGATAHKVVDLR